MKIYEIVRRGNYIIVYSFYEIDGEFNVEEPTIHLGEKNPIGQNFTIDVIPLSSTIKFIVNEDAKEQQKEFIKGVLIYYNLFLISTIDYKSTYRIEDESVDFENVKNYFLENTNIYK